MSDTVELTLLIPVDRKNGQEIWTEEIECEGATWSCRYRFEDNVLIGSVNCNKRYEGIPDLDMWKYTARNQFIVSKEGMRNITTNLRAEKNEYYMRASGVHLLAYGKMICARRRLRNYADERGLCKVAVKIMEIENMLSGQNSDEFALNPGDVILRKSQETVLGRGGDATVYKGEYKGNVVAIKEFYFGVKGCNDPFTEELDRFKQLKHRNLLKLIGYVATRRIIVLELCNNRALHEYVHDLTKEIGWRRFDNWVTDVIEGMAYLHSQDVTHRDLKTANILIGADWSLQITDFARSKTGEISMMSYPTSRVGTVGYMAPELMTEGGDRYTRKVDVWSFGVILWELCTRCVPYKGLSETDIFLRMVARELKLQEPVAFPKEICVVIRQCLSFVANDRPSFVHIKDELWAKASSVIGNNPEKIPSPSTGVPPRPVRAASQAKMAWDWTK